jgi:hypothetical protein
VLPAFATRFRCALTILCEIARVIRGPTAAVAALAPLAPGFHRTRPIIGKIAGALLSSNMSRTCRFLAIECEVAAIGDGSRFRHGMLPVL